MACKRSFDKVTVASTFIAREQLYIYPQRWGYYAASDELITVCRAIPYISSQTE